MDKPRISEQIESWTADVNPLPERNRNALLANFANARGSAPGIAVESARPPLADSQLWALRSDAALPSPMVYVRHSHPSPEGGAELIQVWGVSDEISFASARDVVVEEAVSPVGFGLMIETWNEFEIRPDLLSHCVGSIPGLTLSTDGITTVPPIRWPGDSRIEFQSSERRRYRIARRLTGSNASQILVDRVIAMPIRAGLPLSTIDAPMGRDRLAAAAGATITATLKIYKPLLVHPSLRVILLVWADGTVGIAADSSAPNFAAQFLSPDDALIPMDASTVDSIRIWKLPATHAHWLEGFEGVFKTENGLVLVTVMPGCDVETTPALAQVSDYAARFEANGSCLPELLQAVSECQDRVLQFLLEEDVKRVIRMDKSHPSWPRVYDLISRLGTSNIKQWAREQNK